MKAIYNKTLSTTALLGLIAFLLLSFREGTFIPGPLYSAIIFTVIMFLGYFITNWLLYGQDSALYVLACFVTQLGLIMLYRIEPEIFFKQIMWFSLGITSFIISSLLSKFFIDTKIKPIWLYLVTLILLVSPLLIGVERGGSKSWIDLGKYGFGQVYFQPSELAKITYCLFLAKVLKDEKKVNIFTILVQVISVIGILALSKDLGGAFLFYMTALVLIFVATSRWDITILGLAGVVLGGFLGYLLFGHVRVRFEAWLNPWKDVPGKGYQIVQSLFAIAEGGFFGTGLGLGNPEYIPAVETDFIFSAFTEEFGFLGAIGIILIYFILLYRGMRISIHVKNPYMSIVALGITTFFGLQIFTIIGGVIKLIPLTGVTLPFMSYGGSSMVMSFISLGILNGIWLKSFEDEEDE